MSKDTEDITNKLRRFGNTEGQIIMMCVMARHMDIDMLSEMVQATKEIEHDTPSRHPLWTRESLKIIYEFVNTIQNRKEKNGNNRTKN